MAAKEASPDLSVVYASQAPEPKFSVHRRLVDHVQGLVADAQALEVGLQVDLGGRAGLHADGRPVHVVDRIEARVRGNEHPLAVEEGRGRPLQAEGSVTGRRPRAVADQHVDVARLQRGEPGLGGEVGVLHRLRITEDRGGDRLAVVDVDACVDTLSVDVREPEQLTVHAAVERAAVEDLLERVATSATATATAAILGGRGRGVPQRRPRCRRCTPQGPRRHGDDRAGRLPVSVSHE